MYRRLIWTRHLDLRLLKSRARIKLHLRDTLWNSIQYQPARRLSRVPMLPYQITIALSVTSRLNMNLTHHIRARKNLCLLILRITISNLQATSRLRTVLLHDMVLYRRANINIKIIATSSRRYLSIRLARGDCTALGLELLLWFHTTETSSIRTTDITVKISVLINRLGMLIIRRPTEARRRAMRLALNIRQLRAVVRADCRIIATENLATERSSTRIR